MLECEINTNEEQYLYSFYYKTASNFQAIGRP